MVCFCLRQPLESDSSLNTVPTGSLKRLIFTMNPASLTLLLLTVIPVSYTYTVSSDNLFKCDASVRNCRWFCDSPTSTANRTFDRAVRTDYFTSLVLQPLEQKYGVRHSIFAIGGIEPHCLELSIQCAAARPAPTASLTAYAVYAKSSVLQIHIRCDHFIASYTGWYKDFHSCYDIFLDQMAHHMWNRKVTCKMPFTRNYRLESDGHQYVILVLCVNSISERKFGKPAYWLFVNKRNTPEQNRNIMQKLALPGGSNYQPYGQSANVSGKEGMCRCDLFERYIRKVRSCKVTLDTTATATRDDAVANQLIKPNETQTHAQQGGMVSTVPLEWIPSYALVLIASASVGMLFCAVLLYFKQYMEEMI